MVENPRNLQEPDQKKDDLETQLREAIGEQTADIKDDVIPEEMKQIAIDMAMVALLMERTMLKNVVDALDFEAMAEPKSIVAYDEEINGTLIDRRREDFTKARRGQKVDEAFLSRTLTIIDRRLIASRRSRMRLAGLYPDRKYPEIFGMPQFNAAHDLSKEIVTSCFGKLPSEQQQDPALPTHAAGEENFDEFKVLVGDKKPRYRGTSSDWEDWH